MLLLRARRKEQGIKELRFWVREKDFEEAKRITSVFQKLALLDEMNDGMRDLEEELNLRLKEFSTWENYLREKYDFNLEPSTEKQRKFALRLAASAGEDIPVAILKHKGLLTGWLHSVLKGKARLLSAPNAVTQRLPIAKTNKGKEPAGQNLSEVYAQREAEDDDWGP
jgi:hypothetical protein